MSKNEIFDLQLSEYELSIIDEALRFYHYYLDDLISTLDSLGDNVSVGLHRFRKRCLIDIFFKFKYDFSLRYSILPSTLEASLFKQSDFSLPEVDNHEKNC